MQIRDLNEQQEKIQEDLLKLLDGLDQVILDKVCDIIVDRFRILKNIVSKENE